VKIAIKNPAPLGPSLAKWGDYHFGLALQSALEAAGVDVAQHYWPEWRRDDGQDVDLVLRGKRRHAPVQGKVSLLWVMSHPSTVALDEIEGYDVVYVASATHQALLNGATRTPIRVLRQCTDTSLFAVPAGSPGILDRRDVVFVANSRGVRRDILSWAIEAGVSPAIIGRHWRKVGFSRFVKSEYVDNGELPAFYRASRLSLNDHWADMKHFGIINNRIFDCLACGLPILTDTFPELREVCGDSVLYASDAASCWTALSQYTLRYPDLVEKTGRLWERLRGEYSFEARAAQIVSEAGRLAPRPRFARADAGEPESTPLRELTGALMDKQRGRPGAADVEMFHVYPTPAGGEYLSAHPGVGYLSGGFGPGPWHVSLCVDVAQIPQQRFDVILLEESAALDELAGPQRMNFLRALVQRLRAAGKVGVVVGDQKSAWTGLLKSLDLTIVAESSQWVIATRPPDRR
jgi:hypothetical protein